MTDELSQTTNVSGSDIDLYDSKLNSIGYRNQIIIKLPLSETGLESGLPIRELLNDENGVLLRTTPLEIPLG